MPQRNLMIGEAGKYRVAAELLRRGIHVFFPATDDGIDLFTENGHGIQVKAACVDKTNAPRYHFNFKHWERVEGKKTQKYGRFHPKLTHIICWGIEDDCFWVVPKPGFDGAQINVPRPSQPRYQRRVQPFDKYLEAWNLLTES